MAERRQDIVKDKAINDREKTIQGDGGNHMVQAQERRKRREKPERCPNCPQAGKTRRKRDRETEKGVEAEKPGHHREAEEEGQSPRMKEKEGKYIQIDYCLCTLHPRLNLEDTPITGR